MTELEQLAMRIRSLEDELHLVHSAGGTDMAQGPCPGGCHRQTQGAGYCLSCLYRKTADGYRDGLARAGASIIEQIWEDVEVRLGQGGYFSLLNVDETDEVKRAWAQIILEEVSP